MNAYIKIQDLDPEEQIKPEKNTQKPKGTAQLLFSMDLLPETQAKALAHLWHSQHHSSGQASGTS